MRHILVDMDGVLADFFGAALDLWGFDPSRYPANEWEIANVLGIDIDDFWANINHQPTFWRDLRPYSWTADFVDFLNGTGIPWTVSTWPAQDPKCATQKVEWLREHIAPDFCDYMIGPQKHLFAGPGKLLIDDNDKNVSTFIAKGGSAILFPARWNSLHQVSDGYLFVKAALQHYIGV